MGQAQQGGRQQLHRAWRYTSEWLQGCEGRPGPPALSTSSPIRRLRLLPPSSSQSLPQSVFLFNPRILWVSLSPK